MQLNLISFPTLVSMIVVLTIVSGCSSVATNTEDKVDNTSKSVEKQTENEQHKPLIAKKVAEPLIVETQQPASKAIDLDTAPIIAPAAPFKGCRFDSVIISTDFATGRVDGCRQMTESRFLLTLKPENTPINDSPWYAFKLTSDSAKDIDIVLEVEGGKHRYLPKMSRDKKSWSLLPYTNRQGQLKFTVPASDKPIWIAGQEIIDNQDYVEWGKSLDTLPYVDHALLGQSTQQRPIYKIESHSQGNEWLVLMGRMHPPELTGAMALFPFTQTILADREISNRFRERFNVLIIPNLNPDGVFLGNWRHNANGLDLNRDWQNFTQVETRLVKKALEEIVASGGKIKFSMDFHSTKTNVLYSMPNTYKVENPMFVDKWLRVFNNLYDDFNLVQKPGNNPDNGVFKQFVADTYGVHATTYEMGDNTDRALIRRLAIDAADTLMMSLMGLPKTK